MSTILIAEDEPEVRSYLGTAVNCQGYDTEFAHDGVETIECVRRLREKVSLVLLDLFMPYKNGFDTLQELRSGWPDLPIVTLSGSCSPAHVAAVLGAGAAAFLSKPVEHAKLGQAIKSALRSAHPCRYSDVERYNSSTREHSSFAKSTWAHRLEGLLGSIAASDVPVLLRGETGVGKEVVARSIHSRSGRATKPFLKLNCAALPSELAESELFGYERGAFTGAFKTTPGKFEMANSGTILLDEIGDMDFRLQAKLLQVLQDQEFLRLGAKDTSKVDVRVMAATHCDLEKAVSEGRFRQDLYYRLNVIEIHVPPLRERKDEILGLAEVFIQRHSPGETADMPDRLQEALIEHDWPGNVRELENVIRKFLVFRNADVIVSELRRRAKKVILLPVSPASVPRPQTSTAGSQKDGYSRPLGAYRGEVERASSEAPSSWGGNTSDPQSGEGPFSSTPRRDVQHRSQQRIAALAEVEGARRKAETDAILAALNSTRWNRKQAAKLLNVEYKAFLYKTKKLGIGGRAENTATERLTPEVN